MQNHQQAKTFPEFEKEFKSVGYKYVSLCNVDGSAIVNFNGSKTPLADKLKEIKSRLESSALTNGYYIAKCKNQTRGDAPTDKFFILKGKPEQAGNSPLLVQSPMSEKSKEESNFLSYQEAMKLNLEIADLKFQNQRLSEESERVQKDFDKLVTEHEAMSVDHQQLSEEANTPDIWNHIKGLGETLVPVLSEHFELENKKLDLQAAQLVHSREMKGLNTPSANGQKVLYYEDVNDEMWEQLDEKTQQNLFAEYAERMRKSDPETYAQLMKDYQEKNNDGSGTEG